MPVISKARLVIAASTVSAILATSACGNGADSPDDLDTPFDPQTEQPMDPTPDEVPWDDDPVVEVIALDDVLQVSTQTLFPGVYTFVLYNNGTMDHDLIINGPGVDRRTELVGPGESVELTVTLETGTYEVRSSTTTGTDDTDVSLIEVQ